jgi:hypothetical protein
MWMMSIFDRYVRFTRHDEPCAAHLDAPSRRRLTLEASSIQHDQEQAVPIREPDAAAHPPLQHNQLMLECRVLCLKSTLRLERRGEQGQEEAEQRDHRR